MAKSSGAKSSGDKPVDDKPAEPKAKKEKTDEQGRPVTHDNYGETHDDEGVEG